MADKKRTSIGGQALIEGIMMRGPHRTAMACRLPDGSISTEEIQWGSAQKRCKILRLPVIRGAVALIDSMINGYKALMLSAERSGMLDEEQPEDKGGSAPEDKDGSADVKATDEFADGSAEGANDEPPHADEAVPMNENGTAELTSDGDAPDTTEDKKSDDSKDENSKSDGKKSEDKEGFFSILIGIVSLVLGVGLALVLFMWLPSVAFNLINRLEGVDITQYRALFEGGIKIIIFVLYMLGVSCMKDIRRVFMYHGAEHKSIFCYEKGLELTVENVRAQKRFHPRCGTSFMILMLIVSIIISYVVLTFVPGVKWLAQNYSVVWVLIKLLMMPLICGIGYELIRICGKHDNFITRAISAPGVWLQHISTKEPDDGMIEVAIASIKAVIPENGEDDSL